MGLVLWVVTFQGIEGFLQRTNDFKGWPPPPDSTRKFAYPGVAEPRVFAHLWVLPAEAKKPVASGLNGVWHGLRK